MQEHPVDGLNIKLELHGDGDVDMTPQPESSIQQRATANVKDEHHVEQEAEASEDVVMTPASEMATDKSATTNVEVEPVIKHEPEADHETDATAQIKQEQDAEDPTSPTSSTGADAPGSNAIQDDGLEVTPNEITLVLPDDEMRLIEYINWVRKDLVQRMAINLRNYGLESSLRTGKITEEKLIRLRGFLRAMKNIQMTPRLNKAAYLEELMGKVVMKPDHKFPTQYVEYAKRLLEQWRAINFGAGEVEEEVQAEALQGGQANAPGEIPRPPANHRIYGHCGIMRGILVRTISTKSYLLDPFYNARRDAKIFGHNGLNVGQWWPRQICALRDGAHGVKMGGISGNVLTGAYSILVAAGYEGMDDDQGDVLLYSGSDSHKNEDPRVAIRSTYTQCLERSLTVGRPVRVLRSYRGRHVSSPAKGVRYDGVYKVTSQLNDYNEKGGLYIKFRLVREPNQPAIVTSRPTREELAQEAKVEEGY